MNRPDTPSTDRAAAIAQAKREMGKENYEHSVTAANLDLAYDRGHADGYEEGYSEGYQAAMNDIRSGRKP